MSCTISNLDNLSLRECHAYLNRHNYGYVSNAARGWTLDPPQHDLARLVYKVSASKTHKDGDWRQSVTVCASAAMTEGSKEHLTELLRARISVRCCIMDEILAPQEINPECQLPPGVTQEQVQLALELLEAVGRIGGLSKRIAQYTKTGRSE